VLIQISDVWHPTLFATAETVKTKRKLCEFRGVNTARLHSRSFEFGEFEQTQIQSSSLPKRKKNVVLRVKLSKCVEYKDVLKKTNCSTLHRKY